MSKGISGVIVAVLLIVISIVIAGSFWVWGKQASEGFERSTTEDVERELSNINSNIAITNVVVGTPTSITVKNIGETELDTSKFNVFLDGGLVSHSIVPSTQSTLGTGQTIFISISQNGAGKIIRVTGQYGTLDECAQGTDC